MTVVTRGAEDDIMGVACGGNIIGLYGVEYRVLILWTM